MEVIMKEYLLSHDHTFVITLWMKNTTTTNVKRRCELFFDRLGPKTNTKHIEIVVT